MLGLSFFQCCSYLYQLPLHYLENRLLIERKAGFPQGTLIFHIPTNFGTRKSDGHDYIVKSTYMDSFEWAELSRNS